MAQPFAEPCSSGVIAAAPEPPEPDRGIPASRRGVVLAACVLASSMVFIDGSALTVALPRLRADFGADLASVQWVLNGYVLALASLTLIGGALADVYGKARMLTAGCLLFGVASAACGLAPSATALIAARVVQGVAAAILAPSSLALIGATYPQSERNQAIGIWAAASALTTAGGPVLGGWLTESFGWPMVFWINPPLALIAVGMLMAAAPRDRRESRRFDVTGAVILAGALGLLAWALSQVGPGDAAAAASASLSGPTIAIAVGISAGGLVLYAVWERTSRHPMTPPRLAGNHAFVSLNLATLTVYGALSVMFFLLPFDLVDRRALSATDAGLAFLPFTFGVGLLSRLFGGLADRVGGRVMLITGPLGAALAYLWLALGRNASLAFGVIGPMALLGISFAVLVAPLTASVMSSVTEADEGLASGINNAASRIAQLAGVALAAGVASFAAGYVVGLAVAAMLSVAGAVTVAVMLPRPQTEPEAGPS
jgi:EmrB/QacA subfamily drug resistance transporter